MQSSFPRVLRQRCSAQRNGRFARRNAGEKREKEGGGEEEEEEEEERSEKSAQGYELRDISARALC